MRALSPRVCALVAAEVDGVSRWTLGEPVRKWPNKRGLNDDGGGGAKQDAAGRMRDLKRYGMTVIRAQVDGVGTVAGRGAGRKWPNTYIALESQRGTKVPFMALY